MAVPKRKVSKSKVRSRKASHKTRTFDTQSCSNCGAAKEPHRVCGACGYYRDRQVVTVEAD